MGLASRTGHEEPGSGATARDDPELLVIVFFADRPRSEPLEDPAAFLGKLEDRLPPRTHEHPEVPPASASPRHIIFGPYGIIRALNMTV
jgi:hypothetical protein